MTLSDHLEPVIDAAVQETLAGTGTPRAAVAVSIGGEILTSGVGASDLDARDPIPANARFPLYSISKTYLAIAILRLVEAGQIGLDDPLSTVLPHRAPAQPITIRQLLDHTGGVPDYGTMPKYSADPRLDPATPWTIDQFLDRTLDKGLLLRLVIERVTGLALREALYQLVIDPVRLRDTTVITSLADLQVYRPGYSAQFVDAGTLGDVRPLYDPGRVSHGLVGATASDVARLLDALVGGRIVGLAIVDIEWTPAKVLFLIASLIGGAMLDGAFQLGPASITFRYLDSMPLRMVFDNVFSQFGGYTLSILERTARGFLTFIVPLAFMAWVPATVLLERTDELPFPGWLAWLFRRESRHSQSAGS